MPHPRTWLALIGVAFVAGCSSTAPGASQAQPTATPAPQVGTPSGISSQAPEAVDVCALMPLGDIQARSPFTRPLVTANIPDSAGSPETCTYASAITDAGTSITLVVEGFPQPADAMGALQRHGQDYADQGTPPQAIAGLGDAAYGIPRPEEAGVWAAVGSRLISAVLKGEWQEGDVPDVALAAKFAAGAELLKLVIARLP